MSTRIISALGPVEHLTRRDVVSAGLDPEFGDFVLVACGRDGRGQQRPLFNWTEALRDGDAGLNDLYRTGAGVDVSKINYVLGG